MPKAEQELELKSKKTTKNICLSSLRKHKVRNSTYFGPCWLNNKVLPDIEASSFSKLGIQWVIRWRFFRHSQSPSVAAEWRLDKATSTWPSPIETSYNCFLHLCANSLSSSDGSDPCEMMIKTGSDELVSARTFFKLTAGGFRSRILSDPATNASIALVSRSGQRAWNATLQCTFAWIMF